jgi:hypothetical protein
MRDPSSEHSSITEIAKASFDSGRGAVGNSGNVTSSGFWIVLNSLKNIGVVEYDMSTMALAGFPSKFLLRRSEKTNDSLSFG